MNDIETRIEEVLKDVTKKHGVTLCEITRGRDGYPSGLHYGLTDFDNKEQVNSIFSELDALLPKSDTAEVSKDIVLLKRRVGSQYYNSLGFANDTAIDEVEDDDSLVNAPKPNETESDYIQRLIKEKDIDMSDFESSIVTLSEMKEIWETAQISCPNEVIVRNKVGEIVRRNRACMFSYKDVWEYAMGIEVEVYYN